MPGKETAKRKRPRTCVACGSESSRREMIRVVRTPDGNIMIDHSGKTPGRGAYICRSRECAVGAARGRRIDRALKTATPQSLYEELKEFCADPDSDRKGLPS